MSRFLPFVREAIARLDYVRPEFDMAIAILLEGYEGQHPGKIGQLYRGLGVQLSRDEKRERGIRANATFSHEAWESLTDRGKASPTRAHMLVMLEAMFIYFRHHTIEQYTAAGCVHFQVHSAGFTDCPGCREMDGQVIDAEHARNVRPHSCTREACGLSLSSATSQKS